MSESKLSKGDVRRAYVLQGIYTGSQMAKKAGEIGYIEALREGVDEDLPSDEIKVRGSNPCYAAGLAMGKFAHAPEIIAGLAVSANNIIRGRTKL